MAEEKAKPGYRCTEFYLSFLAMLLGAFLASGIAPDDSPTMKLAGLCMVALSSLGYGATRWGVKASTEKTKQVRAATQPGSSNSPQE